MAGTAAGLTYGAAKAATVRALRVLDCDGSGSKTDTIAALNWVRLNFVLPAVVTMSLGGPRSFSLDQAVDALVDAGVVVVRPGLHSSRQIVVWQTTYCVIERCRDRAGRL